MFAGNFSLIFEGESCPATLIDGREITVHIRALPSRHVRHVIPCSESAGALVEMCGYFRSGTPEAGEAAGISGTPGIAPAVGYISVPVNFSDNFTDASLEQLREIAHRLNFARAENWSRKHPNERGGRKTNVRGLSFSPEAE